MRYFFALLSLLAIGSCLGQNQLVIKDKVKVVEKLGDQVPLDLKFKDEAGKGVLLRDFFGKRPVVLLLVFYRCGGTCTKELEEGVATFKAMKTYDIGRDFEVVTVSIHPKEGADLAEMKDEIYDEKYGRPTGKQGWHFLTGDLKNIRALTDAAGFYYVYDEGDPKKTGDERIQHPNTLIVLTPAGKISQYFNGLLYPPQLVLTSLKRAATGEIGVYDPTDPKGCVQNPNPGKYTGLVINMLRVGGTLFLLGGIGAIVLMSRRSKPGKEDGG